MKVLSQRLRNLAPAGTRRQLPEEGNGGIDAAGLGKSPMLIVDENSVKRRPALPNGVRIYVVGDIHGQIVSLKNIIEKIKTDINSRPVQEVRTIFLGDYVDRGLGSRSVIDTIINESGIGTKIPLKGNHEEMMLSSLDDVARMKEWCSVGGVQTIFSYGVAVQDLMVGRGFEKAQLSLRAALPERHLVWLRGLASRYECGDYFFCHAGIDPDKSVRDQEESDLLWIRHRFTRDERSHAKIIVHGHSPAQRVEVRHNRINVDTGAFFTEILSCVALEADGIKCL